jgi:DNA-binding XRE family transcriptional regulator
MIPGTRALCVGNSYAFYCTERPSIATKPRLAARGLFRGELFAPGFSGQSVELMSDRLPNAIDRHVASRLRLRRLEAGLSQTTLADALGISFQQLQKYEGATNRISAGALYQLALTLDVPVQYFFDGLSRRDKKRG